MSFDPITARRVDVLEARVDALEARLAASEANFVGLCSLLDGLLHVVEATARGSAAARGAAIARLRAIGDEIEAVVEARKGPR